MADFISLKCFLGEAIAQVGQNHISLYHRSLYSLDQSQCLPAGVPVSVTTVVRSHLSAVHSQKGLVIPSTCQLTSATRTQALTSLNDIEGDCDLMHSV